MAAAYTYEAVTLTMDSSRVVPGGQLRVSWVVGSGRGAWDWIGLFKVGDPSETYEDGWWSYSNGGASGTFTLIAPQTPGGYEFRYFANDGLIDATRSAPVTVEADSK